MSMQVEYKLKLGQDEFVIKAEAKTQAEFFEKMSFFSSIPKVGPNGEDDLQLVHRTPQGYNYYSLVSKKAKMEYKFGQSKENIGNLFGKGWEPLYTQGETGNGAAPGIVSGAPIGQPQQTQAVGIQAPTQQVTPQPQQAIQPQIIPQNQPIPQTQVAQPLPTAAPAPAVNTAQVQTVATDVLARFGIKQG